MYHYQLDSPPPASQFRRPWSPDPFDPAPSQPLRPSQQSRNDYDLPGMRPYAYDEDRRRRREPSEVSVEALDLADYAMTLRPRRNDQDFQIYPEDMYPPSQNRRPPSRDSMVPPSLVSRVDTLSSNTHSTRSAGRRPYSLPPPTRSSDRRNMASPPSAYSRYPQFAQPHYSSPRVYQPEQAGEIDVSQFPSWSRNWYTTQDPGPSSPPDIYTPLPKSQFDSHRSPFDPGNIASRKSLDYSYDPYAPASSLGHESSRDLLPWNNAGPSESVDSYMKEERMRMLEREFGPNAKRKSKMAGDFTDENGKPLVGTVNPKGQLVTQGPKKRIAIRVGQIVLALGASIPGIYAALAIKIQGFPQPAPAGTPAAIILYVVSVLTLLLLLFLFVFRPCCCGRRRKPADPANPLANGMMVLPVPGMAGGKKGKKPKPGKKGKKGGNQGMGDVQVNLIVDPGMFSGQRQDEEDDEEEDDDWDGSMPGGYGSSSSRRKRRAPPKRRSVFTGLAMEEDWKRARSWAKKIAAVDVLACVIWGAVFIYIMIGPRCPSGGFQGWCTAFNTSSAAACLLSVAFGISIFFDVKDLHDSKASPRTRT